MRDWGERPPRRFPGEAWDRAACAGGESTDYAPVTRLDLFHVAALPLKKKICHARTSGPPATGLVARVTLGDGSVGFARVPAAST